MRFFSHWRRLAAAVLMLLAGIAAAPVLAQEETAPAPWQEVISAQVQAFRDHDAPAAFSYAGASFQVAIRIGKFHGMIWPTTPSGSWKW